VVSFLVLVRGTEQLDQATGVAKAAVEQSFLSFVKRNIMNRLLYLSNGGAKFTSNQVVSDLLKRAPRAFLERLPPANREHDAATLTPPL